MARPMGEAPGARGTPGSRADAVERHLRRLDAAACRALVADLWAARGFETRTDGDAVVATRRGESRVLYPLPNPRIGSPSRPDRPVDVVVAPRGSRAAERIAADHGARVVDAAGLRDALLYGTDRETAATLCERHLGARPADLRPPLRTRVRERAAAVSSAEATALVGVLAVLLVGGLVGAGATGPAAAPATAGGAGGGAAPDGATDVGEAEAAKTPTARPSWPSGPRAVPGLDDDGIQDLFVLAAAHDRALRNRSYTLWVDYHGARGSGPNATRTHRDTDVAVEGDRYLAVTSVGESDGVDGGDREVVGVVFHDGTGQYVASSLDRNASYRRVEGGGLPFDPTDPTATRRTLVRRYLSTPETTVSGRAERDGRIYYRVVGRGQPIGLDRQGVHNYTVVALVGPEGLVIDLTATYTIDVGQNVSVRREWTYGRIGATSVDPPAWYAWRSM